MTATSLAGPWSIPQDVFVSGYAAGIDMTFMNPVPGLGYSVISSNPPHVKITMLSARRDHSAEQSPVVSEWDLTAGGTVQGSRSVYHTGYNQYGGYWNIHSGLQISPSNNNRSIPKNGLVTAWDMYDSGGATATSGPSVFGDIANGAAVLAPFAGGIFGWNSGQGLQLTAPGPQFTGALGYAVLMKTLTYSSPPTINASLAERNMAEMSGNATWSVATVFRRDTPSDAAFDYVPIWQVGDSGDAAGNKAIALGYQKNTGTIQLGWGTANFVNHYRYATSFTPTSGNWYFMCATNTANGSTPVSHLWTGIGGVLVDELAGVSRAASGGSPSATPNTSSTPMYLGQDIYQSVSSINGAYAGLYVYSRDIGQAGCGQIYSTLKPNLLAQRAVTLQ